MINYSTTDDQREKIHFWIATISISISSSLFILDLTFINKVIAPSAFLIYGLLVLSFDKWLWKIKPFSLFVNFPNLNGKWKGDKKLIVTISQTWRKMDIVFKYPYTISNVSSATFYIDNDKNRFIKYIYTVKPVRPKIDRNLYGEGCCEIRIIEENGTIRLEGNYFCSKLSVGFFKLTKI